MTTRLLFDPEVIPFLVIDLRVSLFSLLYRAKNFENDWNIKDLMHFWQQKVHLPILEYPDQRYHIIFVDDQKYSDGTYWRTRYLKKLGDYPIYKGNRSPEDRPKLYHDLHDAALEYIANQKIPYLSKKGFEADDFAGALCNGHISDKKKVKPLILYTVDSDWGQLVNDDKQILFYYCNTPAWKERLRDESIIIQWFDEKQGIELDDVREIVDKKHEFGDKSDNLEPGSPKEVIDLLNPGKKLPKVVYNKVVSILENPQYLTNPQKSIISQIYLNNRTFELWQKSQLPLPYT